MNTPPIPVIFEPLLKPKPWGGRKLATLFDKPLPPEEPIGESWELVSLPGKESRVKDGPLAGRTLSSLVEAWGTGLYGTAELVDGRFPLLIKFLDAREHLSVQVHPKPADDAPHWQPGVKHEAWYVLHAEPGAEMFIGLKAGVSRDDLARAANTPRTAELLRHRPVTPGQCFYLPSGIVHALGAGIVVAEVQTPSDVTYRLYDWDRVGRDGKPRELHIEQALDNVLLDIPDDLVEQPRRRMDAALPTATRTASCERFVIDELRLPPGFEQVLTDPEMAVWIILAGRGELSREGYRCRFKAGDVVLIPADKESTCAAADQTCKLLEVRAFFAPV